MHAKHIGYEWSHGRDVLRTWFLVCGELEKLLWSTSKLVLVVVWRSLDQGSSDVSSCFQFILQWLQFPFSLAIY